MKRFIKFLLDPFGNRARVQELNRIREQMNFWHPIIMNLFKEAREALHKGDYDEYYKIENQRKVAQYRYDQEVTEKLYK